MSEQQQMLSTGSVIGHYRVIRQISSGGFGNTYEVEHVSLPLRRCIKEFFMRGINQRVGDTVTVSVAENRPTFEQMRSKFLREAQRMAQLHNPHVVPVTDFFEQNGTAYYVMELVEGKSLAETMRDQQRPFSEGEVREMLPQVLNALSSVHAKDIFHLDLKPANILRDDDGHLWLIDFGASKQMSADESQTLSSSTGLCYTPHYAPSELIQGSTKYIGPWTDLYSLGATLYNLLTREIPPEIADIEENGPDAFTFSDGVSDNMRQLILWLMQPRRSDRPQSVAEVDYLGRHPIEIKEPVSIDDKRASKDMGDDGDETVMRAIDKNEKTDENKRRSRRISIYCGIGIVLFVLFFLFSKSFETNNKIDDLISQDENELSSDENSDMDSFAMRINNSKWYDTEYGFKYPDIMTPSQEIWVEDVPGSVYRWDYEDVCISYWPLLGNWAVYDYPDVGCYLTEKIRIRECTYKNGDGTVYSGYTDDNRIWYMKKRLLEGGMVVHTKVLLLIYPKEKQKGVERLIDMVRGW